MAVTAGMIAKAAATALSNEKLRKGIGWGLVAVLSPVILLIAALCSIGTGGSQQPGGSCSLLWRELLNRSTRSIPVSY